MHEIHKTACYTKTVLENLAFYCHIVPETCSLACLMYLQKNKKMGVFIPFSENIFKVCSNLRGKNCFKYLFYFINLLRSMLERLHDILTYTLGKLSNGIYVNISGKDYIDCGVIDKPCRSLSFTINNIFNHIDKIYLIASPIT